MLEIKKEEEPLELGRKKSHDIEKELNRKL